MSFGEDVAHRGWRTGSVFGAATVAALSPFLVKPGRPQTVVEPADWLAVVSQECDLLARNENAEPFVEVLHCRPVVKRKPRESWPRSTRYIEFRPNKDTHPELYLRAHAVADRYDIPRSVLRDHDPAPDRGLSTTSADRILAWYSLRPGRPSWPDAFVERIDHKALDDALEGVHDDVEVRVAIVERDEELPPETDYHVAVFYVVPQDVWDGDIDAREAAVRSHLLFVDALRSCPGISVDLDLSRIAAGSDFTWEETRRTEEWNFANLSHLDHDM